jgi:hypothetical protein
MTMFADLDLGGVLIGYVSVCLFSVAATFLLVRLTELVRPRLAHWWQRSAVRRCYRALSKAQLTFINGLLGNALVVFFCLPLLGVPPGSGIKPMTLPLLFLIIGGAAVASCVKTAHDADRADGSTPLRLLGGFLCLLPFFVGVAVMHLFAAMRDLTFG